MQDIWYKFTATHSLKHSYILLFGTAANSYSVNFLPIPNGLKYIESYYLPEVKVYYLSSSIRYRFHEPVLDIDIHSLSMRDAVLNDIDPNCIFRNKN